MADFNLTSQDLRQMARKLEDWIQEMKNLNLRVKNNVRTIEGWKDEQFNMFKSAIVMTSNQLNGYCESMLNLSKVLKKLADDQDKANTDFRTKMANIK